MILATHALASWFRQRGLDPAEITVVLRAKTPQTEMLLKSAILAEVVKDLIPRRLQNAPLAQRIPPLDVLPGSFKFNGLDILVASLDTAAKRAETK